MAREALVRSQHSRRAPQKSKSTWPPFNSEIRARNFSRSASVTGFASCSTGVLRPVANRANSFNEATKDSIDNETRLGFHLPCPLKSCRIGRAGSLVSSIKGSPQAVSWPMTIQFGFHAPFLALDKAEPSRATEYPICPFSISSSLNNSKPPTPKLTSSAASKGRISRYRGGIGGGIALSD